jgi:asparagine synthase (glutamine-hydrolysing)
MYQAHERALEGVALPQYLRNEDRNSMASSIESRLPFMDFRLVTRALTLPDAAKIHDGWTKKILRDALRDVVPAVVLERRDKMGFPTPHAAWLRDELAPYVAEALMPESLVRRGLYDVDAVSRLHARWRSGDDGAASALWRITSVDLWARAWGL